MFDSDAHAARLMLRRVELIAVDDSGPLQRVTVRGFAAETFRDVLRAQSFGDSGVPPLGSLGIAALIGGRPEQAQIIALEDPASRPAGLGAGERALFNAHGDVIFLYRQKIKVVTDTFRVEAATIELVGAITHTGDMTTSGTHTDSHGHHHSP